MRSSILTRLKNISSALRLKWDLSRETSVLLLHLLSFSPIFVILGNVLPAFGLKVHQYAFGLAFLLILQVLSFYKNGQSFLLICLLLVGLQLLGNSDFSPSAYIDFFFGPSLLMVVTLMLKSDLLSEKLMIRLKWQFVLSALIPISIASLQYFDLLPFKILNADYVNYTQIDGVWTPRINGFFYHGNELVILSFFTALIIVYGAKANHGLMIMFALVGFAVLTRYKSLVATSALCFMVYAIFMNQKGAQFLQRVTRKQFAQFGWAFIVVAIAAVGVFMYVNIQTMGVPFKNEMLTGRGGIWGVYFKAMQQYAYQHHLIGPGIGSAKIQFQFYATPQQYYPLSVNPDLDVWPHPHNPWLGYYLNAGISGIILLFFVLNQWTNVYFSKVRMGAENAFGFAAIALPFLTFGVTIFITQMALYWVCLCFVLITAHYTKNMVPKAA